MINGKNLVDVANFVRLLAWAVLVLSMLTALTLGGWLVAYSLMIDRIELLAIGGILSMVDSLIFLVSVIPVLIWIYIAHSNLHGARIDGLHHKAGWVTFSYFIPVLNWFVPFRAMRELHNRSAGEPAELGESSVDDVTSWWACHMGAILVATVVLISNAIDAIPGLYVTTPFWANQALMVLSLILLAGSAWFLQRIIKNVTRAQLTGGRLASAFE